MERDPDHVLRPWLDALAREAGGPGGDLGLFDAHTHIGANDPDGYTQTPAQLLERLVLADARGAVFPMHEPDGYPVANDAAIAAAQAADGRLVAFCRIDPRTGPQAARKEAARALDAGARGIKLHPRAEQFRLADPAVRELAALAHERRVPILIHAGRGIPALGQDTVALAEAFPDAHLILAHAAISDLAWLWRLLPAHPNVLIDTAWWSPADLIALFVLAPPASVVWASDSPYGTPVMAAVLALRCALQAGLDGRAVRAVAGGTLDRVLAGGRPEELGPAPGAASVRPFDPVYERVVSHLLAAAGRMFALADPTEPVALARLACAVGEGTEHSEVCGAVLGLLDAYDAALAPPPPGQRFPLAAKLLLAALAVARTPDVALPALAEAPAPTRRSAEAVE
jgi:hypothetical protein